MLKNPLFLGFTIISVLTFATSCSDPAVQARKTYCEELMAKITAFNKSPVSPKFNAKGTPLEVNQRLMEFNRKMAEDQVAETAVRTEYTAKCK